MTQTNAILEFMKTGADLTPLEALNLFGCMRLGARIWDLKRAGYIIQSAFVTVNGKTFKRYWI
jgi:hypothetical protein